MALIRYINGQRGFAQYTPNVLVGLTVKDFNNDIGTLSRKIKQSMSVK